MKDFIRNALVWIRCRWPIAWASSVDEANRALSNACRELVTCRLQIEKANRAVEAAQTRCETAERQMLAFQQRLSVIMSDHGELRWAPGGSRAVYVAHAVSPNVKLESNGTPLSRHPDRVTGIELQTLQVSMRVGMECPPEAVAQKIGHAVTAAVLKEFRHLSPLNPVEFREKGSSL